METHTLRLHAEPDLMLAREVVARTRRVDVREHGLVEVERDL